MNIINKYRRNLQFRRGMILLVVMAVLSFFAVMGMTFILMTGKNRDSAETAQLAAQNSKTAGNSPQELLEEGIMQVLVGPPRIGTTQSTKSALYGCDLIGDMYGTVDASNLDVVTATFSANKMTPASADYAGRVVTIAEGPYKGQSTIILNARGAIIPFSSGIGVTEAVPRVKCVINKKRAFQGSATKYDAAELSGDASNDFMSLRYTGGANNIRVGRVVLPSYYRADRGGIRPGMNNNTELGGTAAGYKTLSSSSFASAASTNASPWDVDNDGDGDNDSVWMNLGLPPRPMPDGTLVVPMYAILVEDLDGRLNVNAHSLNQSTTATTTYSSLGTTTAKLANNETLTPTTMINGQGFGPAEVNMEALLGSAINTNVVSKRIRNNSEYLKYCFPEFTSLLTTPFTVSTTTTTTANKFFRSPLDFYGAMTGAIDQNGMFIWQKRGTVGSYGNSSYERDLGVAQLKGRVSDNSANPYSPEELEGVLRVYDDDSKKTESRLLNLVRSASNMTAVRNLITTESWDMPYCDISASGFSTSNANLPEEVRAGFKMDINRPLTSYEDNPTTADTERTKLAKDLYYLIKAAGVTNSKVAAQWAVNAVDFRDADSVCTHLNVDGVDVWGCERPELLITETFAFHARMTEDTELGGWRSDKSAECAEGAASLGTSIDAEWYDPKDCPENPSSSDVQAFCTKYGLTYSANNTGPIVAIMNRVRSNKGDGVADLDQVYKPESGLFIELYNPWISANSQEATNEYKNGGVPLGASGGSMVDSAWRIAVAGGKAGGNNPAASWAEDLREKKYTINRVLYFGSTTPESGQFTYKANASNVCVKPGQFAVIGPTGATILARKESDGSASRQINITSGSNATIRFDNTSYPNVCSIAVPNSGNARFSVTDIGTYTDATGNNGALTTPRDKPYDADDANRWTNLDGIGKGLGDDFEQAGYRIVYLQRLANPYKAYNATTNPYITFDQMPVDLYCYNGRQCKFADYKILATGKKATNSDLLASKHADFFMKSRQRGETQAFAGTTVQLWSAEKMQGQTTLAAASNKLTLPTGSGNAALQSALKKDFYHSMTKLDQKLYKVVSTSVSTGTSTTSANLPSYESVPPYYFPNRPFNSVMELMLVPQVSAYELTSSVNAISKPTSAELTSTSLPKYLHPDNGNIDFLTETGSKILDYVRVQTPYVVTPLNINTYYVNDNNQTVSTTAAANGYRWSFREPGKININSITHPAVWAALLGAKTEAEANAITGLTANMYTEYWGKIFTENQGTRPRTFGASAANYIASNYLIFRMNDTAKKSRSAANSVYFQTQLMQRLSNLTTTRSNVYAVWITVGFFELKGAPGTGGDGISPYQVGREYGLDSGSRQRYRAFYIIDRTQPVGYSPGKRMNADKTIILRRYLP